MQELVHHAPRPIKGMVASFFIRYIKGKPCDFHGAREGSQVHLKVSIACSSAFTTTSHLGIVSRPRIGLVLRI